MVRCTIFMGWSGVKSDGGGGRPKFGMVWVTCEERPREVGEALI